MLTPGFLRCSWPVVRFFSFLVLFIFTGGLQQTKFLLPRVEMNFEQVAHLPLGMFSLPGEPLLQPSAAEGSCRRQAEGQTDGRFLGGDTNRPGQHAKVLEMEIPENGWLPVVRFFPLLLGKGFPLNSINKERVSFVSHGHWASESPF